MARATNILFSNFHNIVTYRLKAGRAERVEAVVARQRHGKHVFEGTDTEARNRGRNDFYAAFPRQRRGKHFSEAKNQHRTIEELLPQQFEML
jgi:hypothetical protein